MEITFSDKKLAAQVQKRSQLQRKQGAVRARKITQRLRDLSIADTLQDMRTLPGRCHELKGNRAGQFALDLDQPFRLIFKPNHEPIPRRVDGGIDWTAITAICIVSIENYHD